jgi:hypothetical protein
MARSAARKPVWPWVVGLGAIPLIGIIGLIASVASISHPSPTGGPEPTTAQVQAAFSQDIPVTPATSQPCNPLDPPDPKYGGCAPGTAPVQVQVPPPTMTNKQRADAEIAAAQGRYEADKVAQQGAQNSEVPGAQTTQESRPVMSNDQADQQMEALYAQGESAYQTFKSGGYTGAGPAADGVQQRDDFGLSGVGALDAVRKRMCALAPYVSPSRNAEFLHDYWLLNIRENQVGEAVQYGPSKGEDDTSGFMMEGGYTWGSEI